MKHCVEKMPDYLNRQFNQGLFRIWLVGLLLMGSPMLAQAADHEVSSEYKLKAALLYKLTRFVEWPKPNDSVDQEFFGLCVLGEGGFGSVLGILENRKAASLPIRIFRYSNSSSIESHCHMLLIEESKRPFLKSIFNSLKKMPILTVGDFDAFSDKGGMVQLTREKKKFGFIVNLNSVRQSNLKIAAPLLQLATVIGMDSDGGEK